MNTTASPAADVTVGSGDIDISNAALASQDVNLDANADSSTAADAKPKSALEAVKSALADQAISADSSHKPDAKAPSADETDSQQSDATKTDPVVDAEAEDAKLPFHMHPRWQAVKAERNSLRDVAAQLEPRARVFDQLSAATQEAGLSGEEFDTGFEIMRLMKTNPMEAWQMLQPFVQNLQMMVGEELPPDLQEKVEQGFIDEETAKEIALLRSNNALTAQQLNTTVEKTNQQRLEQQQRGEQEINAQLGATITTWENSWKQNDPDYQKKQPFVKARIVELIQQHGRPRTAEHALFLANNAKTDIEKQLGLIAPARQSVRTVTGGHSSGSGTPVPKTAVDAVKLALSGKYQPVL